MAQDTPARLEDRVDFQAWQKPGPESSRYQVQDPSIPDDALPGWTLHQSRRVRPPGWPPLIRSTWVRQPNAIDPLLLVDVHVSDSPETARTLAIRVLGDFQSPRVARRSGAAAGEIAFGDGSPGWIVFIRGNLVVSIRNGGREIVPVLESATALDAALVRQAQGQRPS